MAMPIDLEKIKIRLAGQVPLTRFAPSPTGYLHMGHVVNALYVWGIARRLGGQVILRLENHDRIRCKSMYEEALLEDLEWLGFIPDLGLPAEFRAGASAYRQSDCYAHYEEALARLQAQGLVYACDCSRKRILARAPQTDAEELRYDGFCRDRCLANGPDKTLRLRLPSGTVAFDDIAVGAQSQDPAEEIGDVALRDNNGNWTYQFAVVCDDIRQGINLIVRGIDILSSTGRQVQIAKILGAVTQPIYVHHPLLTDANGRKLSKRDFATDIHSLKLEGLTASEVIGTAAHLTAWIPEFRKMDMYEAFDLL